jgi:hypothetical protein
MTEIKNGAGTQFDPGTGRGVHPRRRAAAARAGQRAPRAGVEADRNAYVAPRGLNMITSDEYNGVCVITVEADLAGEQNAPAQGGRQNDRRQADRELRRRPAEVPVHRQRGPRNAAVGEAAVRRVFGMMKVVNPDEHCRKIFEITRLVSRFDIEHDLAAALKGMR